MISSILISTTLLLSQDTRADITHSLHNLDPAPYLHYTPSSYNTPWQYSHNTNTPYIHNTPTLYLHTIPKPYLHNTPGIHLPTAPKPHLYNTPKPYLQNTPTSFLHNTLGNHITPQYHHATYHTYESTNPDLYPPHPEIRIPPHPMITSYTTTTAPQLKVYRNPYDKIGPREIKDAVRTQDGDSLVSRNYVQLSKTCQWFSFCI